VSGAQSLPPEMKVIFLPGFNLHWYHCSYRLTNMSERGSREISRSQNKLLANLKTFMVISIADGIMPLLSCNTLAFSLHVVVTETSSGPENCYED
jgi:hypothetical protein